jgi:ammonia channel protein AmtB
LEDIPDPNKVSTNDIEMISAVFGIAKSDFRPNNLTRIVLGTFILWICWLFFNAYSAFKTASIEDETPARIMMNTILSAAFSGLVAVWLKHWIAGTREVGKKYDVSAL